MLTKYVYCVTEERRERSLGTEMEFDKLTEAG